MSTLIDRRAVLKTSLVGSTLLFGAMTGGCCTIFPRICDRPIRRDITTLDPSGDTIETYKAAVSAMRALPNSDRRSWDRQMQIHLDTCPHGNWFFLPWHRAYLFYFESICRELTGNQDFALPYWNWNKSRSIPSVFWQDGPLLYSPRSANPASTASDAIVGDSIIEDILSEPNFAAFGSYPAPAQRGSPAQYGILEGTPHNAIHGFVGGTMGGFRSPLDPVFWCHHNMVECMWVAWNLRGHANTNDENWLNYSFNDDFADRDGNGVNIRVVETLLMPILSYRFDDNDKGPSEISSLFEIDSREFRRFIETGARVPIEFESYATVEADILVAPNREAAQVSMQPGVKLQSLTDDEPTNRLLVRIEDVTAPKYEDLFVSVFVNKRDASPETSASDPHFAGSFAFFASNHESAHSGGLMTFLVDLTSAVETLQRSGELADGDPIELTFVPRSFESNRPSENAVRIGRLSLGTARAPN